MGGVGLPLVVDSVDKSEELRHNLVGMCRDFLIDFQIGEKRDEGMVFPHGNTCFPCCFDDLFRNRPLPLCDHPWGLILERMVTQGYRFKWLVFPKSFHDYTRMSNAPSSSSRDRI